MFRRRCLVLLVFALAARAASAAPPTYTFVELAGLATPLATVDVALNDRAELAYLEPSGSIRNLWAVLRSGSQRVETSGGISNEVSNLRLRRLTDAGTILYSADYVATDPRLRSVNTWNRLTGPLEIFAKSRASGGNLDSLPEMNEAGQVVFYDIGSTYRLTRWTGTSLQTNLESCPFMVDARPAEDGALVFECRPSALATPSGILRGAASPFAIFVDSSMFPGGLASLYVPFDTSKDGTVLFSRFTAPSGLYTKTPGGVPVLVTNTTCSDPEINDLGQVMCRRTSSIDIANTADPHVVVQVGTAIGSATVTTLGSSSSLNDLGQVAFTAELSDGTSAIVMATPSTCDSDQDGWCDTNDNCPGYTDSTQFDTDQDGLGNRCDNCPFHANPDQVDADADGRGDACAPCSATGVPRCGTRVKGPGTDTFTITNVPLDDLPPRPGLYALVKKLSPFLDVDVSITDCVGGTLSSQGPPVAFFNGDGFDPRQIFQSYLYDASRQGATCTVEFQAGGGPGSYAYLIDSATVVPGFSTSWASSDGAALSESAFMPGVLNFIDESRNHRFLYSGTGGSSFGTCGWSPDPPGDNPEVTYSGAPGPGWDCCTFQYDGVDDVPSAVGQLVISLNGTPPPPDPDQDGFLSPCDSCDFEANIDQKDGGGVNTATPDGIGDACQCGRLDADGIVNATDVALLRAHLAGSTPLGAAQLPFCSVIGGPTECTVRTMAVLRRALASLAPGVQQTCTAAQP